MEKNTCLQTIKFFLLLGVLVFGVLSSCSNYIDSDAVTDPLKNNVSTLSQKKPVAVIEAPAFFEGGVPRNRTLIISFSKPMNTEVFWDKLILTDSLGKNLKPNFCAPVWSNENTIVEIAPDESNPIDLKNKASFDIYVTIPNTVTDIDDKPLYNPIDYRYRINESVDETAPVLIDIEPEIKLVEGNYNYANEEKLCTTNHINSSFDIKFEAKDTGNGEVWAKIFYKRIYDVNGKSVKESEQTKLVKLTKESVSDGYYDTVNFDLSDSKYLDGMYEMHLYAADACGNISNSSSTYFIIRDTSVSSNPNTSISFVNAQSDGAQLTKANLDYYANLITFENLDDDLYYASRSLRAFTNSRQSFTYEASWGLSLSELSEPVRLTGSNFKYELPLAFKHFRMQNSDKDIYLCVKYSDAVGNSQTIKTVAPAQINFFNYEVCDGQKSGFKTIKLNFSNLSNTVSKFADIPEKQGAVSYRIYYGKKEQNVTKDAVVLTRNFSEQISDSVEFEIEDNSVYDVYIQSVYSITSNTNGKWCGQTTGPLYELEVNTVSTGEDPRNYNFSISKSSDGNGSGTFTIDVDIQNGESDVKYYPCYSTDGENWNTYNSLSFQIENPLTAPLNAGEAWAVSDFWKNKSLFEARKDLVTFYPDVTAQVRILAVKGNKAVYSRAKEIVFTQDDDNISPQASNVITSHDSLLSYDGRSFKFDGVIKENDFHTNEIFKYYYTEYNESWDNSLYVLSEDQIKLLPGAVSRLDSKVWVDNSDSSLKYSISPVVPVNGLKDGKYMFFAKVWDTYGNENYITLGKAFVGTFKNKLKVAYDSQAGQFNTTLALNENETRFDRNMINLQILDSENKWNDYYGSQNELQNCSVDSRAKTLISQSKIYKKGAFYRISVQSFNDNTYDENSKTGVNKKYPKPYSNLFEASTVVPEVQNETEYDLYTEETVSNPVYYYVPAQDEDMTKFKGSFFKNTVAISTNKPVIINLISSLTDLGSNIDEWERRGKLIKTYYFKGDVNGIPFKDNDVRDDMLNSDEEGLIYYVMVVHFANNTSEISNVYKIQK